MTSPRPENAEVSPYTQVLGQQLQQLAPVLARLHSQGHRRLTGTLHVRGATTISARVLLWLARIPRLTPQAACACSVAIVPCGGGEAWQRRFGDQTLLSRQDARNGNVIVERVGWFSLHLQLRVRRDQLWIRSSKAKLYGIRLPAILGIRVAAQERAICPDSFRCNVRVCSPLFGLLLSYAGVLRLEKR